MTSFISVKLDIHRIFLDLLYNVAIVYRNLYSALFKYSIPYQYSLPPLANPLCGPRMVARLISSESEGRRVACAALQATHDIGGAMERWSMANRPCMSRLHVHPRKLASILQPRLGVYYYYCCVKPHSQGKFVKDQDAKMPRHRKDSTSASYREINKSDVIINLSHLLSRLT